jgi:ParB/RepB/Spo0J family partition protein
VISYENKIFEIPVNEIIIGERIRKSFPNVDGLAMSLSHKGQMEPIQIREPIKGQYELVNGHRRILAVTQLKWKTIKAIRYEDMNDEAKLEAELELQVRHENFTYSEECSAMKRLVEMKKERGINGLGCAGRMTQRDIAEQIGVSESYLSESLRIADTLIEYPGCEVHYSNRHQILRAIRTQSIGSVMSPSYRQAYEDSFIVCSTNEILDRAPDKSIDLLMVHPSTLDEFDLKLAYNKLKYGGQLLVFCNIMQLHQWKPNLEEAQFNVRDNPYMWHIKREETYVPILWCGKQREQPIRVLKDTFAYPRDNNDPYITKAKSYNLISYLVKSCTDQHSYVVLANCEDIDSIRCCLDIGRNVRACNEDKIMRDRAFLNMENKK